MVGAHEPCDLSELYHHDWLGTVQFHHELDSTNSEALRQASHVTNLPLLVLTRWQRAGRGRGEHGWWAAEGALTFSLLLDPAALGIVAGHWPPVSLITGLAVAEALEQGGLAVGLKWPNDVLAAGRKLGGILIETASTRPTRLVVGIGLNVNNSLHTAPPEVSARATSLVDLTGQPCALSHLLTTLLDRLSANFARMSSQLDDQLADWRTRCVLTGRDVELAVGGQRVSGTCLGIADDGALRVQQAGQVMSVVAGEVRRAAGLWPPG